VAQGAPLLSGCGRFLGSVTNQEFLLHIGTFCKRILTTPQIDSKSARICPFIAIRFSGIDNLQTIDN